MDPQTFYNQNREMINTIIMVAVIVILWMVCSSRLELSESFEESVPEESPVDELAVDYDEEADSSSPYTVPSNFYFIDDGANGEMSIQHNLCSRSCCAEQWPTPFKQKYDPYVCQNKNDFVSSNIMCNNSFQDSGCLCLTKKQAQFMYNRGGNGRGWF